jgi:tetratricopeptide (TPR) repeat protein
MTETANDHDTAVAQLAALLDRRRLDAARGVLKQVLPRYPASSSLLQYAAWVDWLDDRLDEAQATIQRILEIQPDSFDARFLLARIRAEQEQYAEAEAVIIELLKEFPEVPVLYSFYARIMLQTSKVEKAERLAAEALRLDPGHQDALNVHVLCGFITSPGHEQRERLQKLLEEHPDQEGSIVRLVQLLIDEGKTREAYGLSRELARRNPDHERLVEMADSLRHASHWSLLPLRPMQKWGWAGSIGIWVIVVGLLRSKILVGTPLEGYQTTIAFVFLGYVAYSWAWPPMLKRLLR